MKHTHTEPKSAVADLVKGGRLAAARRDEATAVAALQPRLDEVNGLVAARVDIRKRQNDIQEPRNIEEARELVDLGMQLQIIDNQIRACNRAMETGEGLALVNARKMGTTMITIHETELDGVRRKLDELIAKIGPLLFRLYAVTGDEDDLTLTITVKW